MKTGLTTPFSKAETAEILTRFHRDGFSVVRNVYSREECDALRALTDEISLKPSNQKASAGWFVIREPQEEDIRFAEMFIREPVYSLVKEILGPECRFCGQSIIRNGPGQAVSNWHVDDCNRLELPLPDSVPRWPAGAILPVNWLSVQIPLTDVLTVEDGPTEIVAGSHYSGRLCPTENINFEGRTPEHVFCQAGDIYFFNHQTWHRGSPNTGTKTRYLLQLQYARGDRIAVRFQGAPKTPALEKILTGADPQLVNVMIGAPKYI